MSDGELKYPKWQSEFQEAVIEFDREKLFERIQTFETAVFVRLQELASEATTILSVKQSRTQSQPSVR